MSCPCYCHLPSTYISKPLSTWMNLDLSIQSLSTQGATSLLFPSLLLFPSSLPRLTSKPNPRRYTDTKPQAPAHNASQSTQPRTQPRWMKKRTFILSSHHHKGYASRRTTNHLQFHLINRTPAPRHTPQPLPIPFPIPASKRTQTPTPSPHRHRHRPAWTTYTPTHLPTYLPAVALTLERAPPLLHLPHVLPPSRFPGPWSLPLSVQSASRFTFTPGTPPS